MESRLGRVSSSQDEYAIALKLRRFCASISILIALCSGFAVAQNADAPTWRAQMRSSDSVERALAALAAAKAQDRASLPIMRELLAHDKASNVRGATALALGNLRDTVSTPAILALLQDNSGVAAQTVVEALTSMGDPRALPKIVELLDAADDLLRLQAAGAIVTLKGQSQGAEILRRAQINRDPAKAKAYAKVLGELNIAAAQEYLLNLAQRSDPSPTRWASYLALGNIRSEAAVELLVDALSAPHDKGRENAQQALMKIASPAAAPRLWPLLDHSERSVRFASADLLVKLSHNGINSALLTALAKPRSQAAAAMALGQRQVSEAREPIQGVLAKTDSAEREVLARSLAWLRDKRSIPLLRQVLAETTGEGRYGAAWSLGALNASEAREDLQRAAVSSDKRLSTSAIDALGMLADPASAQFLLQQALAKPDNASDILSALAQAPSDSVRKSLESLLSHKDDRIAMAALSGLAERRDVASVPALIDFFEKASTGQRPAARHALIAITKQRWTTSDEWRKWYGSAKH